jgi:serine protease Do
LAVRDLTLEETKRLNLPAGHTGVVIDQVQPGSSTEDHDVREGDLLLEINGVQINSAQDYKTESKKLAKGSLVRLLLGRGTVTVYVAFKI